MFWLRLSWFVGFFFLMFRVGGVFLGFVLSLMSGRTLSPKDDWVVCG